MREGTERSSEKQEGRCRGGGLWVPGLPRQMLWWAAQTSPHFRGQTSFSYEGCCGWPRTEALPRSSPGRRKLPRPRVPSPQGSPSPEPGQELVEGPGPELQPGLLGKAAPALGSFMGPAEAPCHDYLASSLPGPPPHRTLPRRPRAHTSPKPACWGQQKPTEAPGGDARSGWLS